MGPPGRLLATLECNFKIPRTARRDENHNKVTCPLLLSWAKTAVVDANIATHTSIIANARSPPLASLVTASPRLQINVTAEYQARRLVALSKLTQPCMWRFWRSVEVETSCVGEVPFINNVQLLEEN